MSIGYCVKYTNSNADVAATTTVVLKIIQPPLLFPMTSIVNKSGNIECCVNNMFQINKKMIVSRDLELILSMFRRTTNSIISDQHPLI